MKTSQVKCRQDNVRRARRAVEDGQYRKAIQALTSGGLAPSSPEVLAEMLAKHPQSAPTPTPAGPSPSPAVFSEADVIKAVKSFPGGSAPGPLGFALTLQPIMEHILSEVPGLKINVWYLDDGTLCGSPDDLAKALKLIEDEGPALGLDLNPSSTSLRMPILISTPYHPTSHPICGDGFVLLGCPIGPPSFCEVTMLRRVEKVKDTLSKLPDLEDLQKEAALLRSCLALPKVSFSLRSCPPKLYPPCYGRFRQFLAGGPFRPALCLSGLGGRPPCQALGVA